MNNLLDEEEKIEGGWPWKILIFMVLFCTTTVLGYLGLIFGYQPFLESSIVNAQNKIDNLASEVSLQDQKDFLKFYSQVINLRTILADHVSLKNFFIFLEKETNQRVAFEVLSLNIPKREVVLEGMTDNYERLSEQLEAISRSKEVSNYILTQSQIVDGRIRFRVSITLEPLIFY